MSSLYIHIPFCQRKCFYCDFYSIDNSDLSDLLLKSLKQEIEYYSEKKLISDIDTIYFGGGTPSLVNVEEIENILKIIYKSFNINNNPEITIEVNPGTISKNKLDTYKSIGINRISLGIQSFIHEELIFLQRIHTVEEAEESIKMAKESGFENISIDLIYAIPGSTLDDWKENLSNAIKFRPKHISAYSLIYEEGTKLYQSMIDKSVTPMIDDTEAEMYEYAMSFLQEKGYNHYEVSNYSLRDFECRHNQNYWNHSDYLGIGPSAHSFVNRKRWWNHKDIDKYISDISNKIFPIEGEEYINDNTFLEEIIYLGLRSDGIDLNQLKIEFDFDFNNRNKCLVDDLLQSEYANLKNGVLTLTNRGFLLCDEICSRFII